ncbi:hypothetical protein ACSVDA_13710 [Cytobacillus sp. Hm23]
MVNHDMLQVVADKVFTIMDKEIEEYKEKENVIEEDSGKVKPVAEV